MSGIRKFFGLPVEDLTPERESEIIDRLARIVSEYGMEDPVGMFLAGLTPACRIFSETVILPASPFLELVGINGYDYTAFFSKRENVECLRDKILELRNNKKKGS